MKENKLLYFVFVLLVSLTSCSQYRDLESEVMIGMEIESPYNFLWQLNGFAATNSNRIDKVAFEGGDAYTLVLNTDNTFAGKSSSNTLNGTYAINTVLRQLKFDDIHTTKVRESADGNLYLDCLRKVFRYQVFPNQLWLYYSDTQYLVYDRRR